jgi:hypothetical protein
LDSAYSPEKWRDLYITFGGSIAALTGLLFVATSLHAAEFAKKPHLRVRAFGNTFLLVGHLIISVLILAPQPVIWLGWELLVFNIFLFFAIQVRFHFHWTKAHEKTLRVRSTLGAVGTSLSGLSGVSLIMHRGGGLYVGLLGAFILTWVVVWNAFDMTIAPEPNKMHIA